MCVCVSCVWEARGMRGSGHDRGTIREYGTVSQYENKGHRLRIYASANACYRLL